MSATAPTLRRRRWLISANVLVQLVAVLVLAVLVNWLAARHHARYDWTKAGYYKISDKSKQVLTGLKEPVKVIVFLQPSAERDYLEKVFQDARNLLREFQFLSKDKLRVEYVDPQRDRARAEQLVEEYKVDLPNVVIFASGPRHKYVSLDEMVEFDQRDYGQSYRVRAFKGEGAFLSAIQTVTEEQPATVCFLTGHGERDPESFDQRKGYSSLAAYIKRDNLILQKWNLLEQQGLPTNAAMLVIAGPRQAYSEKELNALDQYLKNKGRLYLMLEPNTTTGLEAMLKKWGVQVDDDLAVRRAGSLLGTELIDVNALVNTYGSHPATARLKDINTEFPYARSVRRAQSTEPASADQPRVTELAMAAPAFWGETGPDAQRTGFDPATDIAGPLPLAVATETARPRGVDVDIGVTRMIVVGSASFVDNNSLTGGNLDFFMSGLNWLLQREQLMAVSPKLPNEFRLDMTLRQARAVYSLVMIGMPLAVGLVGLSVWLRRRK